MKYPVRFDSNPFVAGQVLCDSSSCQFRFMRFRFSRFQVRAGSGSTGSRFLGSSCGVVHKVPA